MDGGQRLTEQPNPPDTQHATNHVVPELRVSRPGALQSVQIRAAARDRESADYSLGLIRFRRGIAFVGLDDALYQRMAHDVLCTEERE